MEVAVLISIGVLAAALGIALGRYVWPVRRIDPDVLAKAQTEVVRLDQECSALRSRADQLDAEHKAAAGEAKRAGEEVARLTERVAGLTKQIKEQTKQTSALQIQRDGAADEAKTAATEVARLSERENALTQKLATQAVQLAEQQKQLTTEFENIAGRILKANATELSVNSQKELSAILDPLRERIQDFQKKVENTYEAETREVLSLKEQIKLIVATSNAVGSQADGLAKALRGNSQLLGRWARALRRAGNTLLKAAGWALEVIPAEHKNQTSLSCSQSSGR
jgi:DNA recombination protein RmuC